MKKTLKFQILTFITVLMLLIPMTVMASSAIEPGLGETLKIVVAKMGDKEYATLEELAAEFGDKVSYEDNKMILVEDLELTNTLYIGQADADKVTLVIDLNGHNITAPRRVISVQNADLTVMGDGMVQETDPYYAAIAVYGSTDSSAKNYSVVTVAESVELEGYYGIMVSQSSTNTAYGVVVNCDAKITAKSDATTTGSGLYVNGKIQHITNAPVFNVGAAEINAPGCGIYAAGYAEWNLNGTKITSVENAFGIKAGKFNIKN
ncbi:MAG: hypothetical protein IJO88_03915, partial [Oscillospiraceae bacterium]|nr:hypothetical protein [Oscillospiraceae bacterium]